MTERCLEKKESETETNERKSEIIEQRYARMWDIIVIHQKWILGLQNLQFTRLQGEKNR